MNSRIATTEKELAKKANASDVYTRKQIDNSLSLKANKSDVVNAYCFKGSIDTVAEMPFKWELIPNGAPMLDGEPIGEYDEETNTITFDDNYSYDVVIPIKPIEITETTNYIFCDNLTIGNGEFINTDTGKRYFHTYDCSDAYGDSYITITKGEVINAIKFTEIWISPGDRYNDLGDFYKGYKTWYGIDEDYYGEGEDKPYPNIPYGALANGAVYNVLENDMNYAWVDGRWDSLGGTHTDTEAREEIADIKKNVVKLSNVLRGNESGEAVAITDISPIPHNIDVKASTINILDVDKFINNEFVKNEDGSYTFTKNDNSSKRYTAFIQFNEPIAIGTQLCFSVSRFESETINDVGIQLQYTDDTYHSSYTITPTYMSKTFKAEKAIKGIRLYISQAYANGDSVVLGGIQLELGKTKTSYTPYIDDVSTVKVNALGKNFIDYNNHKVTSSGSATFNGSEITLTRATAEGNPPSIIFYLGKYENFIGKTLTLSATPIKLVNNDSALATIMIGDVTVEGIYSTNGAITFNTSNIGTKISQKVTIPKVDGFDGKQLTLRYYLNQGKTVGDSITVKELQIEVGTEATPYEPYIEPTSYDVMSNGTIEGGIEAIYPTTTLLADTPGVLIEAEYNRDLTKAFAQLEQAIISLGGNI